MNEEKVARICWNTHHWQRPSGRPGKVKSSSSETYEQKYGFGHEEWLFDISKLINGYHYAYIQAIGQHFEKYVDQNYDLSFYTINSATKERWWLGEICNVQVINPSESKRIHKTYKKNGWLKEMYSQLESVGADVDAFKKVKAENFFCVKFKPRDMSLLEEPQLFQSTDPAVKADYYNLKDKNGVPKGVGTREFKFNSGFRHKTEKTTVQYRDHAKNIDLIHNQIQKQLFNYLSGLHGEDNVSCEQDTGFGTKIDIAVKSEKSFIFYELKTANNTKQCIREALSQLLEYAYYPSADIAYKLIIVATLDLPKNSKNYLKNLRTKFSIPIYYRKFDLETNTLGIEE